jgi:hypothetical protein
VVRGYRRERLRVLTRSRSTATTVTTQGQLELDIQCGECTMMSFASAGFFVDREFMRTWPAPGARYASAKQTRVVATAPNECVGTGAVRE